MRTFIIHFILSCFLLIFSGEGLWARSIHLPKLISNSMVLQRDVAIRIWGSCNPNEKVSIVFREGIYTDKADSVGNWAIFLKKGTAGGPFTMQISTITDTLEVEDIMVGDVWLCSGQSNMELPMRRVSPKYPDEMKTANPNIRYFTVPTSYDFNREHKDVENGQWLPINPTTISEVSAVAYFFSKAVYEKHHVPIGLINSSLGGSPAESWINEEALKSFPAAFNEMQKFKDNAYVDSIQKSDHERIQKWYSVSTQNDLGQKLNWKNEKTDTSGWSNTIIPGYWNNTHPELKNGVVWFRKNFHVPDNFDMQNSMAILGCIVDADSVFINGKFVGTTSYRYPPRRYNIPDGILNKGENTIVIRVISNGGKGGFVEDKSYEILSGPNHINLTGRWQLKEGTPMPPLQPQTFIRWKPSGLYNGMIAPLTQYPIKGVIWYQGESNTGNPENYLDLMRTLITAWRNAWNLGDFPFLYVQLANFMHDYNKPTESNWALLREMQLKTLSVVNTGMAVTIDIGEGNDIHPLNKKDVGDRLALAAEKVAYGNNKVIYSGPSLKSMKIKKDKVILSFENTGDGLITKNGNPVQELAIAGENRQFVWAKSKIKGNKLIIWSDDIPAPVAVRYAWADNPADANLYNSEKLPASPFRTDDW